MPAIAAIDNETLDHIAKAVWNAAERYCTQESDSLWGAIVPRRSDSFCGVG
jgi:hypothetical protein